MAVPTPWRTVQSDNASLPRLLLKADLDRAGYAVILTDLNRVWKQTLDRQAIFDYAKEYRTVIDPSEDDEQFDILSTKVRDALHQHDGTSLSISAARSSDVVLDISIPMPRPLAALQWTFHLAQSPRGAVADTLVYPLLERAQVLRSQIDRLLAELQAKDKVISRITDKLERSAYDLTDVLPVATTVKLNKQTSQREQLSKYVPGLGKFNRGAWTNQLDVAEVSSGAVGVGEDSTSAKKGDADHGEWWRSLKGSIMLGNEEKPADHVPPRSASDANSLSQQVGKMEDDLQRQAAPPGLHATRPVAEEDSAPESDDLDRPSQAAYSGRRPSQGAHDNDAPSQPSFLSNADDGSETEGEEDVVMPDASPRRVIKTRSSSPIAPISPAARTATTVPSSAVKKLGVLRGRKRMASSVEDATPLSTAEEPILEVKQGATRPKSRLGTLGGKAAQKETSPPPQPTPPVASSPSPVKPKRLGTIGGTSATSHVSPHTQETDLERDQRSSRSTSRVTPAVKEVRETSVERANRKRNELKRAIEEKAKVPVKKKRKF
ncbi:hypothetical protein B0A48_00397 [Cryoendolithus antarcticus]|uniref:Non-homologous end-joining factor 1 n=1 Tax=Cryoendolithus antarcticus TaxID=1507870 RepID=A0A1V8TUD8_9PEZI|nr:hypothetical protein B0A48_00397 [Cryoendolithus antarcticus]